MNTSSILFWCATGAVFASAAVGLAVSRSTSALHARTIEEAATLMRGASEPPTTVRREELDVLPPPVRRWLDRAGIVGRPRAETVHLRQRGEMHTTPNGAWFPIRAEQWFRTDDPAFVWWMEGRMAKVIPLAGRDLLANGHGEMHVTAGGLLDVALPARSFGSTETVVYWASKRCATTAPSARSSAGAAEIPSGAAWTA
jgi:hypothetical protein